jgi:hypothetical protein
MIQIMPALKTTSPSPNPRSTVNRDHNLECPYFTTDSLGIQQSSMNLDGHCSSGKEVCMTIPQNDSRSARQSRSTRHNSSAQDQCQADLSSIKHPSMLQDDIHREGGVENPHQVPSHNVGNKSPQYHPIPRPWARADPAMMDQWSKSHIENHPDMATFSNEDNFIVMKWWSETLKDQPWNAVGDVIMRNEPGSQSRNVGYRRQHT